MQSRFNYLWKFYLVLSSSMWYRWRCLQRSTRFDFFQLELITYIIVNCNDNNFCTTDSCVEATGQCSHIAIPCTNSTACQPLTCEPTTGSCLGEPINCNDNNNCTFDSCNNGICVFESVNCSTIDACYPRYCNTTTGGCYEIPVNCDDSNPCTIDTCQDISGSATCQHTPITCTNSTVCHPLVCDITVLFNSSWKILIFCRMEFVEEHLLIVMIIINVQMIHVLM